MSVPIGSAGSERGYDAFIGGLRGKRFSTGENDYGLQMRTFRTLGHGQHRANRNQRKDNIRKTKKVLMHLNVLLRILAERGPMLRTAETSPSHYLPHLNLKTFQLLMNHLLKNVCIGQVLVFGH